MPHQACAIIIYLSPTLCRLILPPTVSTGSGDLASMKNRQADFDTSTHSAVSKHKKTAKSKSSSSSKNRAASNLAGATIQNPAYEWTMSPLTNVDDSEPETDSSPTSTDSR